MLESVTTRYYVEYKNQSFLEYQKAVLEYISKDYDNKDIWKSVMLQSKDKKNNTARISKNRTGIQ